MKIYWSEKTESTNADAWKALSEEVPGYDNLSVIAALCQTGGRGQGDHLWHSAPGENLTFTVILRFDGSDGAYPAFPAARQKEISDMTAASVAEYLATHGVTAWIKQPNDVYVGTKKICGILIRHCVRNSDIRHSIIGIGLNINETEFPADLPNPTSLALETRSTADSDHAGASEASNGAAQQLKSPQRYDVKQELQAFMEIFTRNCRRIFEPSL